MKSSTLGYKTNSPDKNESSLYIQGNIITMKGVDKPLTLIPVINGKPQHNMRKIANPGDPDIVFEKNVTGVIEMPYAQSSYGTIGSYGNPYGLNGSGAYANINPTPPIDSSLDGYNYQAQPYGLGTPPVPNFNPPTQADIAQGQQAYLQSVDNRTRTSEISTETLPMMGVDPNQRQQQEASNVQERRRGAPFVGAINPYGNWNTDNAAVMLGASIQDGNALGIIGGAGKVALSLGRNIFSGAAAMNRYNESLDEARQRDAEQRQREGEYYTYQKGGEVIKKRPGLLLTGNFLEGSDDNQMPTAETEQGEYLQTPDGNTMEMVGDRHSKGGELVSVPEGTKVISDYLKIGGKLATYFKKNYNLNVSAGSTFATVLDKYKKKIGLTKLLDEEASILDKIVKQDDVENDSTRDINLQVLSKRVSDLQPEKAPMEEDFNSFTNLVFQKQEESKEPTEKEDFQKQEGGNVDQNQAMLMQAISQYAEMNGQSLDELINQIQALPQDQQEQAIAQIVSAVQGGGQSSQNGSGIEQLILSYSQLTGQDPNTIIQQMQTLGEDEIMQMIQEMNEAVNGQEEQPQVESEITPDPNSAPSEQAEMMKKGGEVKNKWISDKIKKLIDEGKPQEQAIAIAYSMWEDKKMSEGGNVPKYQGSPDQSGIIGRNANLPSAYSQLPFAMINPNGVVDYDLQTLNPVTGAYSSFNPNERIGAYLTSIPVGAENYFERKADGTYGLMEGKTYADFQRGYNQLMDRTNKFFQTQTEGMTEAQKNSYLQNLSKYQNDIIFTTDDESKYKGKTARGIDNKFGQFTSTRSGYQRPIVTPEQKKVLNSLGVYNLSQLLDNDKAKSIVGEDLYNQLKKESDSFGGIDYGLAEKTTPTTQAQNTTENPDPKADINALQTRRQYGVDLPIQTPDQSNLAPNYLATSMRQVGTNLADRVFLSPEANLRELSRQANTASNTLTNLNPYTAGAGLANLQAQQNDAINQAITQTTIANQQDERNVNNINEQRIMQRDQTNLGLADKYEKEQIVGLDNYYNEWRSFIDNRNRQNISNWNLQNQTNLFNAINPNYKIGSMGQIYQTDEPLIIQLNNGQTVKIDPKTKKQIIEKTTSADGKTQTTIKTTQKKKGGLVINTDLSKLLKK